MQQYFEVNGNGHKIRCKMYYQDLKTIRHMVIFCHGFGGHKDNHAAERLAERMLLERKDSAMITFNWPGHGDDEKERLCLQDCSSYLEVLLSYVRQEFHPETLDACATSFGGYLVLKYIYEHRNPFRKIAMRCPAVNMYQVLTKVILSVEDLAKIQEGKEVPAGFDRKVMIGLPFLEELRIHEIPSWDFQEKGKNMLILHGTADEIVPFEASCMFAEKNQIRFLAVEGADHRFLDNSKMEQAIRYMLDFYLNAE